MLKIIAILVLSSQLSVAVETDAGWQERSFPNSVDGASQLMGFAVETIGSPEDGVRVAVGWLNDNDNDEHIIDLLAKSGIKHGLTSPDDVRKAAVANGVAETSALAVAHADIARFGFLYRRKPK
ncbi:hypothetical protein [Ideonella paludis]|uniref:Uncharacterized protein n=1 Tax=Ideonella paludis TaxID=1233411 RepID=A0ABS5DRS7_9BURK|nr:hypothetical protein [Ideonella paludis]MBQ0933837.1 hypothetical protein [Ideonella paludis]